MSDPARAPKFPDSSGFRQVRTKYVLLGRNQALGGSGENSGCPAVSKLTKVIALQR
jgi:hypothetical protein